MEVAIGMYNSEKQCAEMVRTTYPGATGATYHLGNKRCWAEFGDVIGDSDADVYIACLFKISEY